MKATLLQTAVSLLCLATAATAKPILTSSSTSAPSHLERRSCPAPGETKTIWMPETWNIFPQQPDLSQESPVSGIELETLRGESHLEQVMAFRGIPHEATTCTLGWAQAHRTNRTFLVDGDNALLKVRPLSELPQPATYDAVKEVDRDPSGGNKELHPDLTFWDDSEGAEDHVAGKVACAHDMYFRVALNDPKVKSHVYLGADQQNGFWIEYSC